MLITSVQALSGRKLNILVIVAFVAGLPLWLQSILDLFGLGLLFPVGLLILGSSIVQLACGPLYLDLLIFGKGERPGSDGLIATASLAAWVLSLINWAESGAQAGAAYAGYGALMVVGGLAGHWVRAHIAAGDRAGYDPSELELPFRARMASGRGGDSMKNSAAITAGETVIVANGERSPVDGVVIEGVAEFSSMLLNGDPMPSRRGPGDVVLAGERCFGGSFRLEARRSGPNSLMWRALRIAEQGQKSHTPDPTDNRLGQLFLPIGLTVGLLAFGVWSAFGGIGAGVASALAVLALSAPAALGLSAGIPLLSASHDLKRLGGRLTSAFDPERASDISDVLVGTGDILVRRTPVATLVPAGGDENLSEDELLRIGWSLLNAVNHPLTPSLDGRAAEGGLEPLVLGNTRVEAGQGVIGTMGRQSFLLGNPALLSHFGVSYRAMDREATALEDNGQLVLWLAEAEPRQRLLGLIAFGAVTRRQAGAAIGDMKANGFRVSAPLIGGMRPSLLDVLRTLPLDEFVHADGPAGLAQRVEEKRIAGSRVAVASGSIVDLAAAAHADLRVGQAGGPTELLGRPDVIVRRGDAVAVGGAVALLRGTGRQCRQNAYLSFFLSGAGMLVASLGLARPGFATILGLSGLILIAANLVSGGQRRTRRAE